MAILILQFLLSAVVKEKKRIFMAYRASSEMEMLGDVIALHFLDMMLPCDPRHVTAKARRGEEKARSPRSNSSITGEGVTRFTSMFDHLPSRGAQILIRCQKKPPLILMEFDKTLSN